MIITSTTCISFLCPDEHEAMEKFKAEHDMTKWREDDTSQFWSFRRVDAYQAELEDVQEVANSERRRDKEEH